MKKEELIEAFEQFEINSCDLIHEQISTKEASAESQIIETLRNPLCDKIKRNERLGCAHSMANTRFLNLVDKAILQNYTNQILREDFESIITSIYLLDHKKGELEKKKFQNNSKAEAKKQLEKITIEHRNLMQKLKELRVKLIKEMKGL